MGKIHVWQSNEWVLSFMYYPVIYSLLRVLPLIYNEEIDFKLTEQKYEDLSENDVVIWVGVYEPSINELKQINKKIHTIHFNLEPFINDSGYDEIWTYSRYMYNLYKDLNKNVRFIPIICDAYAPKTIYSKNNYNIQLTFIGNLSQPYGRSEKVKLIQESGVEINEICNLWNDEDYNLFIINNTHIYLNINKSDTKALPSVRINKLLSHKCIIISEYTNAIDEELYSDLVFFKNLDEIGDFYKGLLEKSVEELENVANTIYQRFSNRFNLENAIQLIQTHKP